MTEFCEKNISFLCRPIHLRGVVVSIGNGTLYEGVWECENKPPFRRVFSSGMWCHPVWYKITRHQIHLTNDDNLHSHRREKLKSEFTIHFIPRHWRYSDGQLPFQPCQGHCKWGWISAAVLHAAILVEFAQNSWSTTSSRTNNVLFKRCMLESNKFSSWISVLGSRYGGHPIIIESD